MPSLGNTYYLRQNIQLEPLIDHWYAWPHLIPPATAARNITQRHVKIMESYINAPQVHMNAVRNPRMLGGPFIDYPENRVADIRSLLDRIKKDRHHLFELSLAIETLDDMLRRSALGFGLQPLYAQVPDILKGYVELVYDLNGHASFRLIEALLYESGFYDTAQQSLMLSIISVDERAFVLSTPRLDSDDCLHLHLPFAHPSIDKLFELKKHSAPFECIQEMLGTSAANTSLLRSFLTEQAPPPYVPYAGTGVRWRYFGHACILVETQHTSILLDPVLSYTYEHDISRYTYLDLPDTIDYVLITHNHQDHVLFETLLQIRSRVKHILVPRSGGGHLQDPSLKLLLERCGFQNVIEISEMEELGDDHVQIMGLPFLGEHADLDIQSKAAWLITAGRHRLLFAADSCNIEPHLYQHIHQMVGDVDVLFLGMECDGAPLTWLYGPLLTQRLERAMDESRRLAGSNYEQGMSIVNQFGCKEVYVYAMGQEPWLNYIMSIKYTAESRPIVESNRLIQNCHEKGIVAERLFGEKEILLAV